jgi:hypothetical protein
MMPVREQTRKKNEESDRAVLLTLLVRLACTGRSGQGSFHALSRKVNPPGRIALQLPILDRVWIDDDNPLFA